MGSIFGTLFRVSTWGESHGAAVGVVVDGVPAGLPLEMEEVQAFLDRRKPGQSRYASARAEDDRVEILSGIFEGQTTGTPISMMVRNADHRSADYSHIQHIFRPGHADYTFWQKYGIRDYRGGGRSSARETIGRVAGGAIAAKLLEEMGMDFLTYTKSIGPHEIFHIHPEEIAENPLNMPDKGAAEKAMAYIEEAMRDSDSVGGVVECRVNGLPVGLGENVFEKLDARLAEAMLSIGAAKGFEIGAGFEAAGLRGSIDNDAFKAEDGRVQKNTNYSGGVLGGMSDGSELVFRVAFKPTPSIAREQSTITTELENTTISIHGRHDPVIVPRAVVVVESMAALVLADLLLLNATARMEWLHRIYDPGRTE
ncbi:MAG: chorismate synthase [Lachnospiraceae bacterium]|nr:chorismate synthase [Lachnospiraceae bacterium]